MATEAEKQDKAKRLAEMMTLARKNAENFTPSLSGARAPRGFEIIRNGANILVYVPQPGKDGKLRASQSRTDKPAYVLPMAQDEEWKLAHSRGVEVALAHLATMPKAAK